MAIFRSAPHPSQDPTSSLRLPASKRVSASQRLSTIVESGRDMPPPTVPLRSILRPNAQAFRSQETFNAAPPAYGLHGSSIAESEDLTAPVEGEKLAQLRRGGQKSRGGWKRLLVIILIILVIVGLAVGLGVGLTIGKHSDASNNQATISLPTTQELPQFPLGTYSFVTALRVQQTDCTSSAATWRCSPYTTFASSNTSSSATLNWIITNTSSTYALHNSGSTTNAGIPANLSISSINNPFSISFANQALTYISESGNSSSARYTFNFTLPKVVIPSPAITSDNSMSQCFFNNTIVLGSIYLNSSRTYPDTSLRNSSSLGGFDQWPYAVQISQVSQGGSNVPDCYETVNGQSTTRILNVLTPQPANSQCICDYRNF